MRLLIVGCGAIGRRHAANAASLAETGVVDTDAARSAEVAAATLAHDFGNDLESALAWQPTGVVVAVPHSGHAEVARRAMGSGADVLVEKPISSTPKEAEALLDWADSASRAVYGVCNMRFHPAVVALRENLKWVGRPLFARAHYGNYLPDMRPGGDYRALYAAEAEQGGVILDAIHELDYLAWLFGPIDSVISNTANLSDLEIAAEDYAGLLLHHRDGTRSEVHLDYVRPTKRRGCEIVGTDGILDWGSEGKTPERCAVRLYTRVHGWTTVIDNDAVDIQAPFRFLMEAFVESLNDGKPRLQTGQEALAALETAHQARGSR